MRIKWCHVANSVVFDILRQNYSESSGTFDACILMMFLLRYCLMNCEALALSPIPESMFKCLYLHNITA